MIFTMDLPVLVMEETVSIETTNLIELPPLTSSFYQRPSLEPLEQEEEPLLEEENIQEEENVVSDSYFNPYDVSKPSHLTPEQYYLLLEETGLGDVAWAFHLAEETYGVNGLFLVGLAALESGWGNSERSHRENNLTGYNIISDSSSYSFETRADSLFATAKLIATDYLTEGGRYHLGTSVYSINLNYSSDEGWGEKIISIANKLLQQL